MDEFLSQYVNPEGARFNDDIIYNLREEPLVPYIVEAFKHLETTPYIKFIDYEHITNYTEMDLSKIDKRHVKGKSNDYVMDIKESYLSKLIVRLKISFKDKSVIKEIPLLLPEKVNIYYYYLNGKKYYPIYQLVDNSTYSSKGNIVLKTMLLPLIISRKRIEDNDVNAYVFKYNLFTKNPNKNPINLLNFFFAEFGCTKTLKYFKVDKMMKIVNKLEVEDNDNVIIPLKNSLVIEVDKEYYNSSEFVKNMTHTLEDLLLNTTHVKTDILDDIDFWISALGSKFLSSSAKVKFYDKGKNILISFKRLLDSMTKSHLKICNFNKKDVFAVSRWIITNFNELKYKNSLDLINKRLRLNEYIASYLVVELSDKMNRILTYNKLNFEYLEKQFNMRQDLLITKLQSSPLLQYDDTVNDMNILSALKVSSKGPSSIGGKNTRNINMKYKALHHSQLGRIDICTGSASSVGITGMLSPFIKMNGYFFDDTMEVQSHDYNFYKIRKEIMEKRKQEPFIMFDINTEEEYNMFEELKEEFKNRYHIKIKNKTVLVSDKVGKDKPLNIRF